MDYKSLIVGVLLGTFSGMILIGLFDNYSQGIHQGRIELFTGQVICRQIPLQGIEIELECKTRKEIEDMLRFIQPQGDMK
jgi:hypothetical protein